MCFRAGLTNLKGCLSEGYRRIVSRHSALLPAADAHGAVKVSLHSITGIAVEELETHRERSAQEIGGVVNHDGFLLQTRLPFPVARPNLSTQLKSPVFTRHSDDRLARTRRDSVV